MRRRLTPFVQVAFGLLASSLLNLPALLAQHIGLGASPSPAHFGGQVHIGPAPSLPGPAHSSGLPSGPMNLRPGVRFPSSPIHEGQYRPPAGPSHRPDSDRHGVGYRSHDPYIYTGYTWLNPLGYGFPLAGGLPYDNGQDDTGAPQPGPQQPDYGQQPPADYASEPPAPQVADNAPPAFRPAYQGQSEIAPVSAQPATTLIFKDGRPPVQVHNYALTANTLYALDGDSHKEIPLSLVDVQATIEANRAAGVDFALPSSR
jgi:hypothetical protein